MDGGAGMEECDDYCHVVSKIFRSEEGYKFYNEYAKVKGFSVRKEEVKYCQALGCVSGGCTRALRKDTV
jgi:hypothetical protein